MPIQNSFKMASRQTEIDRSNLQKLCLVAARNPVSQHNRMKNRHHAHWRNLSKMTLAVQKRKKSKRDENDFFQIDSNPERW